METICAALVALAFACGPDTATAYFVDIGDLLPPKPADAANSMAASAADLDGDGDLDLAIAVEYGRNRILLNDGTGRFAEGRLVGPSGDHEDVAIADFDGDGDQDLVFVGEDDQVTGYHLNDGHGNFTEVTDRLPSRATSNTVVAADLDGDGWIDLVVANAGPDFIWMNDGTGRFTDESAARLPGFDDVSQDIAVGDVDGDGSPDLVFGNEERNRLYLNDGAGFFTDAPLPLRDTPEETRDVHLVDIDGDGDLDIYFANVRIFNPDRDQQDRLLLNDGKGNFTDLTTVLLSPDDELTTAVAFLDFTGDGRLDLIRGRMGDLQARDSRFPLLAFTEDRTARFGPADGVLPPSAMANAFDIEVADFNGDGRDDLFVASRGGPDRLLLGVSPETAEAGGQDLPLLFQSAVGRAWRDVAATAPVFPDALGRILVVAAEQFAGDCAGDAADRGTDGRAGKRAGRGATDDRTCDRAGACRFLRGGAGTHRYRHEQRGAYGKNGFDQGTTLLNCCWLPEPCKRECIAAASVPPRACDAAGVEVRLRSLCERDDHI